MEDLYDEIERKLGTTKVPVCRGYGGSKSKKNVTGKAPLTGLFGYRRDLSSGLIQTTKFSINNPELETLLVRLAKAVDPDFKFTHVQVNKNFQCLPHYDSNNCGESLFLTLGRFKGGHINVEGETFDCYRKPMRFDGSKRRHWTEEFEGDRYAIIYFNNSKLE